MKLLLIISALCLSSLSYSQTYGYFGKKNTLSINGTGAVPVFYWFIKREVNNYKSNGNKLTQQNDLFDAGLNIAYTHAFSGSFAFGFEYDLLFGNVKGPTRGYLPYDDDYYNYNYNIIELKHEELSIRTNVFMPKIEYTFTGTQLPLGINNQLGIGYSTTKIIEKDYIYVVPNLSSYGSMDSTKIVNRKSFDYDELKAIKGITIMYAFNVRTPISKHLMINYGIRYTLNMSFTPESSTFVEDFVYSSGTEMPKSNTYLMDSNEIKGAVGKKRLSSIMTLNLGLTYVF